MKKDDDSSSNAGFTSIMRKITLEKIAKKEK
jgi:hypothetical protein